MLHRAKTVVAPGWEALLRAHGLDSVEGVYGLQAGEIYTRSGSTEVRRVQLGAGTEARDVFIKKYWIGRPSQLWSGMFRGTLLGVPKARREFENLRLLRSWRIDAPEPVAFGEERRAGWVMRSFLISEAVPESMPLHGFIRDRLCALGGAEARRQRLELILNLAGYTRRLHEHRFVHHDYFWRNILLSGARTERFFLIDAHKGRHWHAGEASRARARDLAALDSAAPRFFRRTERLRFFLLYHGQPRLDPVSKSLLRRALHLAAPMREKQLRRVLGSGRKPQPAPAGEST